MTKGLHPEDIKAAIRKKGVSLKEISIAWGFSESAVRMALKRPMPSVEPRIANFIGMSLHEIWPTRYDADNFRIFSRRGRKSKTSTAARHAKNKNSRRSEKVGTP